MNQMMEEDTSASLQTSVTRAGTIYQLSYVKKEDVQKVDLQLMVFNYPRSAENRTFRPPVTQNQKNTLNFKKG